MLMQACYSEARYMQPETVQKVQVRLGRAWSTLPQGGTSLGKVSGRRRNSSWCGFFLFLFFFGLLDFLLLCCDKTLHLVLWSLNKTDHVLFIVFWGGWGRGTGTQVTELDSSHNTWYSVSTCPCVAYLRIYGVYLEHLWTCLPRERLNRCPHLTPTHRGPLP